MELASATNVEWDAFVAAHPEGHHEQSSRHGASRVACGYSCDLVVVREGGRVVGGAQVLAQRSPAGTHALVLRAPLALDNESRILSAVIEQLDSLARRKSYASIRIELFPTQVATLKALEACGFRESVAWFGERPSLVLPLTLSDADLLARMKPKGRYNVRLAERSGVSVVSGDASALDDFFALHQTTASYQEFPVFPREYFDYFWDLFGARARAHLFMAHFRGKPIAAVLNTIVGDRMYYGWGGMSREPDERKLMANYVLHVAAARRARELGCSYYDLVGVTEFKEKLARDEIRWPRPRRKYYGALRALRRRAMEVSWSNPLLRRGVRSVARRLGLSPRLPY